MSRAFIKEPDAVQLEGPPELELPAGPNPVTSSGYTRMGETLERLRRELAIEADEAQRNRLARDVRYWEAQKASATIMPEPQGEAVSFGSRVTLSRDGRAQTIEIVGEGEADPSSGRINWQSPLAVAIMGARAGDVVTWEDRDEEINILAVQNSTG